jgi:hypothetical protein
MKGMGREEGRKERKRRTWPQTKFLDLPLVDGKLCELIIII